MKRRIFSIITALSLCLGMLPVAAMAAGDTECEEHEWETTHIWSWDDNLESWVPVGEDDETDPDGDYIDKVVCRNCGKYQDWMSAGADAVEGTDYKEDGNGNYTVYTAKGLASISYLVYIDCDRFIGATVTLADDIDLLDGNVAEYAPDSVTDVNSWTPIGLWFGSSLIPFFGSFDGNGHTVKNLYIHSTSTSMGSGLFGAVIAPSALIPELEGTTEFTNVRLEGARVTSAANSGNSLLISIAASVVITDCSADPTSVLTVTGFRQLVGGIVGGGQGEGFQIRNCSFEGTVSGGSSTCVGGIVGGTGGIIENCVNSGSVSGGDDIGGIVGYFKDNDITTPPFQIWQCVNTGNITGTADNVGGIAGSSDLLESQRGTIMNCYNTGSITGTYAVGGIIGTNRKCAIENCYSDSTVTATNSNKLDTQGAIVGTVSSGSVARCYYNEETYTDTDATEGVTGKGTQSVVSGEVAWLLNQTEDGEHSGIWSRDTDGSPVLANETSKPTYKVIYRYSDHSESVVYSSADGSVALPAGDYDFTTENGQPFDGTEISEDVTVNATVVPVATWQTSENGEWISGSFADAIEQVYSGGTVKLLKDVALTPYGTNGVGAAINKPMTITSADPSEPKTISRGTGTTAYLLMFGPVADIVLQDIILDGGSEEGTTATRGLVASYGKLTLERGAVLQNNNNTTSGGAGGGICVIQDSANSSVTMKDGAVIQNCQANYGGGVAVVSQNASFTMEGGEIRNCASNAEQYTSSTTGRTYGCGGGALYIEGRGKITVEGGEISGNTAENCGGAAYVSSGTLTVNNGTILDNTAEKYGGAVYIYSTSGAFVFGEGTISGNTAHSGGGVFLNAGIADIYGGTITGNRAVGDAGTYAHGGGILVGPPGNTLTLYLSGSPVITGNTSTENPEDNIQLDRYYDSTSNTQMYTPITLSGKLGDGAQIGVAICGIVEPNDLENLPVVIGTTGTSGYTPTADDYAKFSLDNYDYQLEQKDDGSIILSAATPVTGVSLDKTELTLSLGDTDTLTATITPENATYQDVIWSSDDQTVATVDENGVVTAVDPGEAVITVTTVDGGYTDTCTVKVSKRPQSGFEFGITEKIVTYGDPDFTVTATGAAEGSTVTYESSNAGVATVDAETGEVTIVGVGTTTITAEASATDTSGQATVSYDLTVLPKAITITADSKIVYVGSELPELTYTESGLVNGDGLIDEPTLTCDADLAVAGEYAIKISDAYAGANYTITYVDGLLTVTEKQIPDMTITADPADLTGGGTVTLTVAGVPGEGVVTVTCSDETIVLTPGENNTWTAELPNAAAEYVFTADYPGSGEYAGAQASCKVIVARKSGGEAVRPDVYTIYVEDADNGTVETSRTRASEGTIVTVTVTPDKGYELDSLTVTNSRGRELTLRDWGDGTYTFRMPDGRVTVEAVFASVETDGIADRLQELFPDLTPEQIAAILTGTVAVPPKAPSGGETNCPSRAFMDLDTTAWYHEAVDYVLNNGVMSGYPGGLFGPDDTLSRAMLVQILYNLEGRPAVSGGSGFADVAGGAWYADAVTWAAAHGIAEGYGGLFDPESPITREQLAVMLYRYARYRGYDVTQGGMAIREFRDYLGISEYAMEAMTWAVNTGVMGGNEANALLPQNSATRAVTAQMLKNFLEK